MPGGRARPLRGFVRLPAASTLHPNTKKSENPDFQADGAVRLRWEVRLRKLQGEPMLRYAAQCSVHMTLPLFERLSDALPHPTGARRFAHYSLPGERSCRYTVGSVRMWLRSVLCTVTSSRLSPGRTCALMSRS